MPLTEDFKAAYADIASHSLPGATKPRVLAREYAFQAQASAGFSRLKSFSPKILHVGTSLGVNFKSRAYSLRDRQAHSFELLSRPGLRLMAYLGSLLSLQVRLQELQGSDSHTLVLDEILHSPTGSLWSQQLQPLSPRGCSLVILDRDIPSLLLGISHSEEYLFGRQVATFRQHEVDSCK